MLHGEEEKRVIRLKGGVKMIDWSGRDECPKQRRLNEQSKRRHAINDEKREGLVIGSLSPVVHFVVLSPSPPQTPVVYLMCLLLVLNGDIHSAVPGSLA